MATDSTGTPKYDYDPLKDFNDSGDISFGKPSQTVGENRGPNERPASSHEAQHKSDESIGIPPDVKLGTTRLPPKITSRFWFLYFVVPVSVCLITIIVFFTYKKFSDSPEAWLERANTFYRNMEYGEALTAYQKSNIRLPDNPETLVGIANCYCKLNKPVVGLSFVTEAVKIDPKYTPALLAQSDLEWSMGEGRAAVSAMLQATEMEPNNIAILLKCADLFWRVSEFENSYSMYQKVIILDPDNTEAKKGLTRSVDKQQQQAIYSRFQNHVPREGFEKETISTMSVHDHEYVPPEESNEGLSSE